jgi:hypothetical protein
VSQEDLQQVFAKEPIVEQAVPASKEETTKLYTDVASLANYAREHHEGQSDRGDNRDRDRDEWDGRVRPWNGDWIQYDHHGHQGPVFCNPYHDREIRVSYYAEGQYYVRVIPAGQSLFLSLDIRIQQAYSFTAVEIRGSVVLGVSNGYFHPHGYRPPAVYNNIQVQVNVNITVNNIYPRPFVVRNVVDCGPDRGMRRFLFDGSYTAWGYVRGTQQQPRIDLVSSAKYPGFPGAAAEPVQAPPEPYVVPAQPQPRPTASEQAWYDKTGVQVGGLVAFALIVVGLAWVLVNRKGAHS